MQSCSSRALPNSGGHETPALLPIHLPLFPGKPVRPGGAKAIGAENLILRPNSLSLSKLAIMVPKLKRSALVAPQRIYKVV